MYKRLAPAGLGLLLLALLLSMLLRNTPGPGRIGFDPDMQVDLNIQALTLIQGVEGRSLWELKAREAGFLRRENQILLNEPVFTYFGDNDADTLKIWSSQGKVSQDDQVVHMWPDVRAQSGELHAKADSAVYMEKDGRILLEDNVVFSGRGMVIRAPRATIFLEKDMIVATGGVGTSIPGSTAGDSGRNNQP